MTKWTKDQKSFWLKCNDTTKTTTQDEDAWVDELYKNNPEFHNDNDDMINDEEVMENNG